MWVSECRRQLPPRARRVAARSPRRSAGSCSSTPAGSARASSRATTSIASTPSTASCTPSWPATPTRSWPPRRGRRGARPRRHRRPLLGLPVTIKDSIDVRGLPVQRRLARARRPSSRSRRDRRRAPARRRCVRSRQDQRARVQLVLRDRQRRPRPHQQSARPGADAGRLERRRGGARRARMPRRSGSAPTAAARCACPRTTAAWSACGRPSGACPTRASGPRRAPAATWTSSASARSRATSRTSRSCCRSSPVRIGIDPYAVPAPLGDPARGRAREACASAGSPTTRGSRCPRPTRAALAAAVAALADAGARDGRGERALGRGPDGAVLRLRRRRRRRAVAGGRRRGRRAITAASRR